MIGLTSYSLFRISNIDRNYSSPLSYLSAVIYLLITLSYRPSQAVNTELIFNFFTTSALLFCHLKRENRNSFLFGLCLGTSFILKYTTAFFIILIPIYVLKEKEKIKILLNVAAGYLTPIILGLIYFIFNDTLNSFFIDHILRIKDYAGDYTLAGLGKTFLVFHNEYQILFFVTYLVLPYALYRMARSTAAPYLCTTLVSLLAALSVSFATGKPWSYYAVALFPFLSILIAEAVHSLIKKTPVYFHRLVIVSLLFLIVRTNLKNRDVFASEKDEIFKVSQYLRKNFMDKSFYALSGDLQILDFLHKNHPFNKYIHRTFLYRKYHTDALDIKTDKEYEKIAQKRPEVVIIRRKHLKLPFLWKNYEEVHTLDNFVFYKLRAPKVPLSNSL